VRIFFYSYNKSKLDCCKSIQLAIYFQDYMQKTVEKLSQDLTKISLNDKEITLIGTAHVSEQSADIVEKSIKELNPDCVAIELCEPRLQAIKNPNRWQETDIFNIIRTGKSYVLITQLVLASFQKRVAEKLGIRPGEEMLRALATIEEVGTETALVDRQVRTTLKRAWAKTSWWSSFKLLSSIIGSLFSDQEEISEKQIEELKSQDALSLIIKEFSDMLPGIKSVLIDERDKYMAKKLSDLPYKNIVAVVGAGHVPGMTKFIGEEIDLEELEEIPPPSKLAKFLTWGIPALIIGMIAYGFYLSYDMGSKMFGTWFIINGVLSAIGASLALAHPITIITAFFVAPFTSVIPVIGVGYVCGLVEAFLRKPQVKDFNSIAEDLATVKGWYKNRLSRTLLVLGFSNFLGAAGTFIGGFKVYNYL